MSVNVKNPSKRVTNEPLPRTQVSSRNDIFQQEEVDQDLVKEEADRMDTLMRQLMGGDEEDDEEEQVIEETVEVTEEAMEEDAEEFTFNLFSNQKVSTVKIADEKDNTDHWSKVVADQQEHEFDETDPEFLSRVNQVVVDYETILKQSTVPYPTLRLPHRVLDLSKQKEEPKKVSTVKKRKSKKCRDFEKAVKEGKIKLKPNMRKSEDGWPGYPGNLTRVAIVDYQPGGKKKFGNTRGGFNSSSSSSNRGRGGIIRGNSRGGSGGMMARGNSRGGSGFSGRGKSF